MNANSSKWCIGSATGALKKDLQAYARSLGFDKFGVASAESLSDAQTALGRWVADGRAGEMAYMAREPDRRAQPRAHLPNAQSVIALAMGYYPGDGSSRSPSEGKISRYAWGRDYHKVLSKRLDAFVRYLRAMTGGAECRTFVDTGPLLERAFAKRAGIGFIGKNTMLITRGRGSWVFLASVITEAVLPTDALDTRSCGECRRCLDACPTGALTAPYELDARRCIAYLTIEQRGAIDPTLRSRTDGWIYGCDVCQDVCPHNTRVPTATEEAFRRPAPMIALKEILSLKSEDEFEEAFGGTAVLRAQWRGMLRNACVAAAALGRQDLVPELERLASQDDPLIREHASGALTALEVKRRAPRGPSAKDARSRAASQ